MDRILPGAFKAQKNIPFKDKPGGKVIGICEVDDHGVMKAVIYDQKIEGKLVADRYPIETTKEKRG